MEKIAQSQTKENTGTPSAPTPLEGKMELPKLPLQLSRGYQPAHPDAPINPATGTKYRDQTRYFEDYWSIPMSGRYYLFERVPDLLIDVYFRGGHEIIDFSGHNIGGNLTKFRVLACLAWMPADPDTWEKLFIGRYTDSLHEAVEFLRPFQNYHAASFNSQGFGIHRYDPSKNTYMFDQKLFETVSSELEAGPIPQPTTEVETTFISSSSRDYGIAKTIYSILDRCSIPAFCAPISLPAGGSTEFSTEIDAALDSTSHLIVLATHRECFESPWFDQEWRTWLNERRSGRKKGNVFVLLGDTMQLSEVPIALRFFETRKVTQFDDQTAVAYFR